jgi:hypothetical protein
VAVAERELQLLALQRGTIADASDVQLLFKALGNAFEQIRNLRAGGAVECACAVGLDPRCHRDGTVVELHRNVVVHNELKLALRPLHLDDLAVDGRGNARGNRNWLFANA